MAPVIELDALIVGAGFGGCYQLKRLREEGFNVKLVESGTDYGGVWYWNRYPGARVDIPMPHYQFSDPDIWTDWTWKERFPGSAELRSYFQHVAQKWDIRKDTIFETTVIGAEWDSEVARWTIRTQHGQDFTAKFFLPSTGFAAKRYVPDWKGINTFRGEWIHPSYWPKEEPELSGKKIAVIGTGSTGVQLCQALAPLASELVLFQRTPNLTLPMRQEVYGNGPCQAISKDEYAAIFEEHKQSYGGLDMNFLSTTTFEHNEAQRKETYQRLIDEGGFKFWLGTYHDMLFDDKANTEAYNFWRDTARARISNDRLKEKLAPTLKPHPFGTKRCSLENDFYEMFDNPIVSLVDVNDTPIAEVTSRGIRTSEKEWEFDYIICATGFDALTGGLLLLDAVGQDGVRLEDKWKAGVKTYMGLCVSGFPNMFFTYGPQAPTALCNGPVCAELQGEWIVSTLKHMRDKGLRRINALEESENSWTQQVLAIANTSLLPAGKSWYMGDNVPGKTREPLIYLGGVPNYYRIISECAEQGYSGFDSA